MVMLIESGEINQIIVVTGGKSNLGISPIEAAKKAYGAGVIVSTIGIINLRGSRDKKDIEEAEEIAKAGGGLYEYSHIEELGRTIQNLTHKTARKTIEQMVSRQLKTVIGEEIKSMEPKSRLRIIDFIEKYGENINLKCVVVLDTSGSMRDKLAALKKSLVDLLENLRGRKGNSCIAVVAYPGKDSGMCSVMCRFTSEISILRQKLELISSGEGTPIGPAILEACELMQRYYETLKYHI